MSAEIDFSEAFPMVSTLLGAYLHQDFHFDHGSLDGAIDAYTETIDASERKRFAEEVSSLVSRYRGRELDRAIDAMGNHYDYQRAGVDASAWLARIAERVAIRSRG